MLVGFYGTREGFQRVNREAPCPICGKPDWCLVAQDGSAAICARVDRGAVKLCGEAGWLHRLRDRDDWRAARERRIVGALRDFARRSSKPRSTPAPIEPGTPDLAALAERCAVAVSTTAMERFARELGVGAAALRRLCVGWFAERGAWTFPMRDPSGRVTGVRLRFRDGGKLSVRGGREGLFLPDGIPGPGAPWPDGARLYVTEGASDCAALLTLGLPAIGRPSCTGGVHFGVDLARGRSVLIVADADPPGQRGAKALGEALKLCCPDVRIIRPPDGIKDAREWVKRGATRAEVERAVELAEPIPRWSARAVAAVRGGVA